MTHGVIGNTSDFGSAESWFEPRWVNRKSESGSGSEHITLFVLALALTLALVCRWVNKKNESGSEPTRFTKSSEGKANIR